MPDLQRTTIWDAVVTVPYPVEYTGDGLLMQLLGDDGVAAPRLVNGRLTPEQLTSAFAQLQEELVALTQAVHLVQNPHGFD